IVNPPCLPPPPPPACLAPPPDVVTTPIRCADGKTRDTHILLFLCAASMLQRCAAGNWTLVMTGVAVAFHVDRTFLSRRCQLNSSSKFRRQAVRCL
ncbi:hypothetical protein BV898_20065, partial [Hypsibius exemplaris]